MMSDEKERQSGEQERQGPAEPVLPTVEPSSEKQEPPKASLHPAFYIAYVSPNGRDNKTQQAFRVY